MTIPLKDMSVLIVDDNPANIQLLVATLRSSHRIRVADSGPNALVIAESDDPPDLILLDIMMPGMDGYEVCRRLKQNPKTIGIPIIFITAKAGTDDEAYGINLGAVDYISKPVSIPVVKARVRVHLLLKQRTDLLEELAMVDGLTGVANRRCFDKALDREWRRAARKNATLSLIMIDIDFFKPYNDNYGHGAGDECLRKIAQVLQGVIQRPADLVARYGGEEFCVLLPDTDAKGAAQLAESLRRSVDELKLAHAFSPVAKHMTISAGFASMAASPAASPTGLVEKADRALYEAKNQGRNQVRAGEA